MGESNFQMDYFNEVLMRNYCRASEENDLLYEELADARDALSVLFRENADLRHRLASAGIEVPASDFITAEQMAEIQ